MATTRRLPPLAYALGFWRMRPTQPAPGGRAFTIHRRSQYSTIFGVLVGVSLVEMVAVHVILHRSFPTAANVLVALGAYGIVWLFGDLQALRLRPILVENGCLRVRAGVRREVDVALADIAGVERSTAEPRGAAGYVRCTAFGPPELIVRLRAPVEVTQLAGKKRGVTALGLTVDDRDEFVRALSV